MKGSIVFGVLATLLVFQNADGASVKTKAPAKRVQAIAKKKKAEAQLGPVNTEAITESPEAISAPSSELHAFSTPVVAQSTSSAKTSTPRKIKADMYTYVGAPMVEANRGSGTAGSGLNYLGIRYLLSDHQAISIRQQFEASAAYGDDASDAVARAGDIYIRYGDSKLAQYMNDGTVGLRLQANLGTGENARYYSKQRAMYSARVTTSKPIDKTFSFDLGVQGAIFDQARSNYFNREGKESATSRLSGLQFATLNAELGSGLTFAQLAGVRQGVSNSKTDGTFSHARAVVLDSSISWSALPGVNLSAGVFQDASLANGSAFIPFDEKNSEYYLSLDASI